MYTFKNSEKNASKASNYETKSMLYLLSKLGDKNEIYCITFDCFNDVNGINDSYSKIWDVQAKNEGNLNPKKIGEYFYTLFKNFDTDFPFKEFIFFCRPISEKYKINKGLRYYGIENIKTNTLNRIRIGLIEKIKKVENIEKLNVEQFLNVVTFIEDDHSESDYIKSITNFKEVDVKPEELYKSIFNDLRDIQLGKKNNTCIENKKISHVRDVLKFERHLLKINIEELIISRIIGVELFKFNSIPKYFFPIIQQIPDQEDVMDLLDDCNSNLAKAFFNTNSTKSFWQIVEKILIYVKNNSDTNINIIYKEIFTSYIIRNSFLTENTIKYLISIIIDGYDN